MEKVKLRRDCLPPIEFTGEKLGDAINSSDRGAPDFSGETGRSYYLSLYRSRGGKYVCYRETHTLWQSENDSREAEIHETMDEVIEFFGPSRLAIELLDGTNIDYAIKVD